MKRFYLSLFMFSLAPLLFVLAYIVHSILLAAIAVAVCYITVEYLNK